MLYAESVMSFSVRPMNAWSFERPWAKGSYPGEATYGNTET